MTTVQTSQEAVKATFCYKQRLSASMVKEFALKGSRVTSSRDSYDLAIRFWDIDSLPIFESVYALYLNRANVPICWAQIGQGGISGCFADIKLVLSHALLCGASSIIIFHNHPSGNLDISQADKQLTAKLKSACQVMDIALLDHLVIIPIDESDYQDYYSFADSGTL